MLADSTTEMNGSMSCRRLRMISTIVLMLMIAVAFPSCGENKPIEASRTHTLAVIFCDLTASTDASKMQGIIQKLSEVVGRLPMSSHFIVYPIDCARVDPIAQGAMPDRPKRPSETTIVMKARKEIADAVAAAATEVRQHSYSEDRGPCSCIMETIEIARSEFDNFKKTPGANYACHIIYLSDMLEHCMTSPLGKIDFRRTSYDKTIAGLDSTQLPASAMDQVSLTVLLSPRPYAKGGEAELNPQQLENIWRRVFADYGLTEESIRQWHFLTSTPNTFPWEVTSQR